MARRGSGCLKVLVGLILLPTILGGIAWFLPNLGRVIGHEPIDAVVIDLVASVDSDGDTVYAPVYEYEVEEQVYRYESKVSLGGLLVPEIGDTRTLLYNPDNPADARVNNTFLLLVLPALLVVIPLLIVFAMIWSAARRSLRRQYGEAQPIPAGASPPPWGPPSEATSPDRDTITATYMGTETSQMDDRGRVRYRIRARAEIGDEVRRFESEWLDDDPTLDLMQLGNRVEVRIEPGNPANYEVVVPH
jgi:hypothetical protein